MRAEAVENEQSTTTHNVVRSRGHGAMRDPPRKSPVREAIDTSHRLARIQQLQALTNASPRVAVQRRLQAQANHHAKTILSDFALGDVPVHNDPQGQDIPVRLRQEQHHADLRGREGSIEDPQLIRDLAMTGIRGRGVRLPHFDAIQRSFGRHDISHIEAHTGADARGASRNITAAAYAVGNKVAFDSPTPSLYTAAHEAAHVVQQAAGLQLPGGVGTVGDRHERQADDVASAVVHGRSAEPILNHVSDASPPGGHRGPPSPRGDVSVQRMIIDRDSEPISAMKARTILQKHKVSSRVANEMVELYAVKKKPDIRLADFIEEAVLWTTVRKAQEAKRDKLRRARDSAVTHEKERTSRDAKKLRKQPSAPSLDAMASLNSGGSQESVGPLAPSLAPMASPSSGGSQESVGPPSLAPMASLNVREYAKEHGQGHMFPGKMKFPLEVVKQIGAPAVSVGAGYVMDHFREGFGGHTGGGVLRVFMTYETIKLQRKAYKRWKQANKDKDTAAKRVELRTMKNFAVGHGKSTVGATKSGMEIAALAKRGSKATKDAGIGLSTATTLGSAAVGVGTAISAFSFFRQGRRLYKSWRTFRELRSVGKNMSSITAGDTVHVRAALVGSRLLTAKGKRWYDRAHGRQLRRGAVTALKVVGAGLGVVAGGLLLASNPIGWFLGVTGGLIGMGMGFAKVGARLHRLYKRKKAADKIASSNEAREIALGLGADKDKAHAIGELVARTASDNAKIAGEMRLALSQAPRVTVAELITEARGPETPLISIPLLKAEAHDALLLLKAMRIEKHEALATSGQALITQKLAVMKRL